MTRDNSIDWRKRMTMKWKDLSGEERYRVVEMARKKEVPIKQLCRTFGVSRQTLKVAMEKADRAAMEALEPQKAGRKGRSKEQVDITKLTGEKASMEKDLNRWKQKYGIAMTFVDLHRKILNGQDLPGEEKGRGKKRRSSHKTSKKDGRNRRAKGMDNSDDGVGDGGEG
jgi:transposase-like protein